MTKNEITKQLQALKPLLDSHHVQRLRLFGSVVRGEANKNSDIDLLVDFKLTPDLWSFIGLQRELSEKLSCTVDLVTTEALHPALREQILKEAQDVRF
jgi:predicted nucleotidyltransferase